MQINNKLGYVYMITSPTNRIYIGSSINIERRFLYYKSTLAKTQIKLYRSFKKYGYDNHKIEIVWAGPVEDMLKYETLIGWGFDVLEPENLNLMLPKLGNIFSCISEKTRIKMSNSAKKRPITSINTRKKISKVWKGRKQTAEHINKRIKSYTGFKHSNETKEKMSLAKIGKKRSAEANLKISKARQKPIIQYDLNMNFIKEWDSATIAAKELNIKGGHISSCCRSERKSCKGFKWNYKK